MTPSFSTSLSIWNKAWPNLPEQSAAECITLQMMDELVHAFTEIEQRPEISTVVIKGEVVRFLPE